MIPTRNEVLARINKGNTIEINQAIQRVEKILKEVETLPTTIQADLLGKALHTQEHVVNELKRQGWKVNKGFNEEENVHYYTVE